MALKWYVVHTYSGHENKARLSLQERIKQMAMDNDFGQILIPTESVLEMVKGQKRTTTRKFYPGYMFVQMEMNERTYHLVRNTAKITGFLGGTNPTSVNEKDIAQINSQMSEGAQKPKPRISFEEGESVRVIDGPFANFAGIVDEVKQKNKK
jgi:transcription termination/antitermination protein NusG